MTDRAAAICRVFSGLRLTLALLLAVAVVSPALAAGRGEPGPFFPIRVEVADREADLLRLQRLGIDVDGVFDGWARAYVNAEEYEKLYQVGFIATRLPDEGKIGLERMAIESAAASMDDTRSVPTSYHTYATLTADLQAIAAAHSDIARLESAGSSVQGRSLWVMKISDNPLEDEDEPEVAYISSMHGDEVVGKELTFALIEHLTDNYGTDPRVTSLVDDTEIWIMPSMNPDGTELGQRYNANGYDLNRNFPDQFVDANNTTTGRQAETAAVMNWSTGRNINLSMNYHGGALLVNYPFDSNPVGSSTFSPAPDPDHPMFLSVSRTFADTNPPMYANTSGSIINGVTNGADWYSVNGGMQDWRYVWHGGFEVLVEISSAKWPPATELPQFWADNQEGMLAYFERVHGGVRGIVTAADTGEPLVAEIRLDANPFPVYSSPRLGDYHRLVLPGTYSLHISAPGYLTRTFDQVVVAGGPATRVNASLEPVPGELQPAGNRVEDGGDGVLEPGETGALAVTLRNTGRTATSVAAVLKPISWYTEVTRPVAGYADIPMDGERESNAPHHEVSVAADAPTGHRAGFYLEWTSAEGRGVTEAFYLDVGQPDCETVAADDLPQTISKILSPHSELIATHRDIHTVRVGMNLLHTYVGDLSLLLTAPSGTTVLLHDRSGGGNDNLVGTYPDSLTPAEPLSSLLGQSSAGTWQLDITDALLTNNGSLEGWSVDVCGYPTEPTPEMRFRDFKTEGGSVELRWWEYPGLWSYRVYRSTDPSSRATFSDVTGEDPIDTDTRFLDSSTDPLVFYLVTGVGPQGEGPK